MPTRLTTRLTTPHHPSALSALQRHLPRDPSEIPQHHLPRTLSTTAQDLPSAPPLSTAPQHRPSAPPLSTAPHQPRINRHVPFQQPSQVLELCQSLRLHSTRANRNRSTSDLQRLAPIRTPREWPQPHRRQPSVDAFSRAGGTGRASVGPGSISPCSFNNLNLYEGAATP